VKEASGNITQMANVIHQVPPEFIVLSGDDAITLPLMALGGRGIVSVVSNEIPAEMTQLAQLCLAGDFAGARALQRKYLPLMEINFIEDSWIQKYASAALPSGSRLLASSWQPVNCGRSTTDWRARRPWAGTVGTSSPAT
jgi:4-hydroxy-tetrahydrodipicolinate synthase